MIPDPLNGLVLSPASGHFFNRTPWIRIPRGKILRQGGRGGRDRGRLVRLMAGFRWAGGGPGIYFFGCGFVFETAWVPGEGPDP